MRAELLVSLTESTAVIVKKDILGLRDRRLGLLGRRGFLGPRFRGGTE